MPAFKHQLAAIDDEYLSDLIILIGNRKTGPIFLSNRNRKMAPRSVNHVVEMIGAKAGITNPNPRLTQFSVPFMLRPRQVATTT